MCDSFWNRFPLRNPTPRSGKSYLEHRRARHQEIQLALDKFRCAANSLAEGWVQRDTPSGARGFALVDRSALPLFVEKIGLRPHSCRHLGACHWTLACE